MSASRSSGKTQSLSTYWLIDAGGLTDDERRAIDALESGYWVYAQAGLPEAKHLGPVLLQDTPQVADVAQQVLQDLDRCWAVAQWHSAADWRALTQHAHHLKHLKTADQQRFFMRFADSRCWLALWPVLTTRQQAQCMGVLASWVCHGRDGQTITLSHAHEPKWMSSQPLVLTDPQLASLLEACWPDQLLADTLAQHPDLAAERSGAQRHAVAVKVCQWLRAHQEDRYPVEKAIMWHALRHARPEWTDAQWQAHLHAAHQDMTDVSHAS